MYFFINDKDSNYPIYIVCKLFFWLWDKNILIAGSLPSQTDTYVEDKRDSASIEKDFYEQAKIIGPHVDFFYLDVVSSGREIDIASNIALKLNKPRNKFWKNHRINFVCTT